MCTFWHTFNILKMNEHWTFYCWTPNQWNIVYYSNGCFIFHKEKTKQDKYSIHKFIENETIYANGIINWISSTYLLMDVLYTPYREKIAFKNYSKQRKDIMWKYIFFPVLYCERHKTLGISNFYFALLQSFTLCARIQILLQLLEWLGCF